MSAIEWTDRVWNPVTGCDRVSPGCANCYALAMAPRLRRMGAAKYVDARDGGRASGPAFGVTLHPRLLEQPLHWTKPRRVFVNSMSDLFHEDVPDEFVGRVFNTMVLTQRHTFQVLTKRPERMLDVVRRYYMEGLGGNGRPSLRASGVGVRSADGIYASPNIWLGVSIENRRFVSRADVLRETPSAVRFVSAEPLLGPLIAQGRSVTTTNATPDGSWTTPEWGAFWGDGARLPELDLTGIDWLIVGGESGAGARPMRLEWARDLRDAAADTGTAFFMKQLGGRRPGGALEDLPADLRVREFPAVRT